MRFLFYFILLAVKRAGTFHTSSKTRACIVTMKKKQEYTFPTTRIHEIYSEYLKTCAILEKFVNLIGLLRICFVTCTGRIH